MSTESAIYSSFASDPCYAELIEMYISEVPDRISTLESLLESDDWGELRRLAHQIKGSAPGYGFESVGEAAKRAEASILNEESPDDSRGLMLELADLLRRVRAVV